MVAQTFSPIKSFQGCVPPEGPKSLTQNLDFQSSQTQEVDLFPLQSKQDWSATQCIYFDNSNNASSVTLVCNATFQRIVFPPQACGYVPVLVGSPDKFEFTSAGNVVISVQFLNYYMPPCVWSAVSVKGT